MMMEFTETGKCIWMKITKFHKLILNSGDMIMGNSPSNFFRFLFSTWGYVINIWNNWPNSIFLLIRILGKASGL